MKSIKRGIALMLAVLLCISALPAYVRAEEPGGGAGAAGTTGTMEDTEETEEIEDTEDLSGLTRSGSGTEETETEEETEDTEDTEEETETEDTEEIETVSEDIRFNLGSFELILMDEEVARKKMEEIEKLEEEDEDAYDWEMEKAMHWEPVPDWNETTPYTIRLEKNAFFPYEVQFTCNGKKTTEWFLTPEDTVTIGGHVFSVESETDGTAVTRLAFNVAGDTVVAYPIKKEFDNDGSRMETTSLLPLKQKALNLDLRGYSPLELTWVMIEEIATGGSGTEASGKLALRKGSDYSIYQKGDHLDLSDDSGRSSREMIVGTADQLDITDVRCYVTVVYGRNYDPDSDLDDDYYDDDYHMIGWLSSTVYGQDDEGERKSYPVYYMYLESYFSPWELRIISLIDRKEYGHISEQGIPEHLPQRYVRLALNSEQYNRSRLKTLKAFEGEYDPIRDAGTGKEITEQLLAEDMTQKDAGYKVDMIGNSHTITLVGYAEDGSLAGYLSLDLRLQGSSSGMGRSSLTQPSASSYEERYPEYTERYSYDVERQISYETAVLYKEFAADGQYAVRFSYYTGYTNTDNSKITAAFIGNYDSIAEARKKQAEEITELLHKKEGYVADYSQGVFFTFFIGEDKPEEDESGENESAEDEAEEQEIYKYCIRTEASDISRYPSSEPQEYAYASFHDLWDVEEEKRYSAYRCGDDSYASGNYVTFVTEKDVDLSRLALDFSVSEGANLRCDAIDGIVKPRETLLDFSNGVVQLTALSEGGSASTNYWVRVIKCPEEGELYINSLTDEDSHTTVRDGVTYSTRELMLDSYRGQLHEILLTNVGMSEIPKLSVELDSDAVELSDYWTLWGDKPLNAFMTEDYGTRANRAKLTIKAKQSAERGSDVTGTLTIKSGDKVLMVLTLTGTVGDPGIKTKEIPKAVKFVPYGSVIQNSNKYSFNKTSYRLVQGKLPDGMVLKENGELYGVPKEAGEFTFTVQMDNSYRSFTSSVRSFTMTVLENTDENVDGATDENYELTARIDDLYLSSTGEYELVSQGVFDEFVDLYLDGEKLERETDYQAESGSTRITIAAQTLTRSQTSGAHTLGIEYRNSNDEVKKAAQNYRIRSSGSSGGSSGSSGSESSGGSSSSGSSGGSSSGGSSDNNGNTGSTGDSNSADKQDTPTSSDTAVTPGEDTGNGGKTDENQGKEPSGGELVTETPVKEDGTLAKLSQEPVRVSTGKASTDTLKRLSQKRTSVVISQSSMKKILDRLLAR